VKNSGIKAIVSGVFAFPLEKEMLGKSINEEFIKKMIALQKNNQINPAGEGGELETTVLDALFFKKKIELIDTCVEYKNYSGTFIISKVRLVKK
jgi:diphthamide synthase (EF-2-diphthine--ammonia ligase)